MCQAITLGWPKCEARLVEGGVEWRCMHLLFPLSPTGTPYSHSCCAFEFDVEFSCGSTLIYEVLALYGSDVHGPWVHTCPRVSSDAPLLTIVITDSILGVRMYGIVGMVDTIHASSKRQQNHSSDYVIMLA